MMNAQALANTHNDEIIDVKTIRVVEYWEIAAALNQTKNAIEKRARRERWTVRNHSVRGGKKAFFVIADLPDDVQRALVRHRLKSAAPAHISEDKNTNTAPTALMKDWQRRVLAARQAILAEIDRQVEAGGSLNKVCAAAGLHCLSDLGMVVPLATGA